MESAFLLWHISRIDTDEEDSKLIGVYRNEEDARAAIERLRDKPGFAQEVAGFSYERYELNKDHWVDGFKVVDELT